MLPQSLVIAFTCLIVGMWVLCFLRENQVKENGLAERTQIFPSMEAFSYWLLMDSLEMTLEEIVVLFTMWEGLIVPIAIP